MVEDMEKDDNVRVVRNYKIASFLVSKGYKIINIKRHRDFICEITNLPCDKRTVFAFLIEGNFLDDYEFAKKFYDEIN